MFCACETHRDDYFRERYSETAIAESRMGQYRDGTYKGVWGCIADICRGAPGADITIKCDFCTGAFCLCNPICCDWPSCQPPSYNSDPVLGHTQGNLYSHTLHLCMDSLYQYWSHAGHYYAFSNTILHEMFHMCGVSNFGPDKSDYLADCCIYVATGKSQYQDPQCY
jgi:hypothetical protein